MVDFARQMPFSSALHVELEAYMAGLLIPIHQGWTEIELESDYVQLVASLRSPWVEWITKTIRAFSDIQVCHIFREANCVAHKLAHTTNFSAMDEFA